MSGNSSSNIPSTSPIDRKPVSVASGIGALEEHESELADLHLVAVAERSPFDALLVDIGAIERPRVGHHVALGRALHLGVAPRDGDVVERDLAVRMAPDPGDVALEREPRTG